MGPLLFIALSLGSAAPTAADRDDAQRRCAAGNERACRRAAELWLEPALGVDAARARAATASSCAHADGAPRCFVLGRMLERGIGGPKDPSAAQERYRETCARATNGHGLGPDVAMFGGEAPLVRAACRALVLKTSDPAAFQPACDALKQDACDALRDVLAANRGADAWPVVATTGAPFVRVAVARFVACGVRADRRVACFGAHGEPLAVPRLAVRDVAVGDDMICLVDLEGRVACHHPRAAMRVDEDARGLPPADLPRARAIAVSRDRFCIAAESGAAVCWSVGKEVTTPPPGPFARVLPIAASTCGVRPEGAWACWGPAGDASAKLAPQAKDAKAIADLGARGCMIAADGALTCWGRVPAAPVAGTRYRALALTSGLGCAVQDDGALACWKLGAGGLVPASATSGQFADVALGELARCLVTTGGELSCVPAEHAGGQVWSEWRAR